MSRKIYDPLIARIANAIESDFNWVEKMLKEMIKEVIAETESQKKNENKTN